MPVSNGLRRKAGIGRRSTLILIPQEPDEKLIVAQDGKPLPEMNAAKTDQVYSLAMIERKRKTLGFKGGIAWERESLWF